MALLWRCSLHSACCLCCLLDVLLLRGLQAAVLLLLLCAAPLAEAGLSMILSFKPAQSWNV